MAKPPAYLQAPALKLAAFLQPLAGALRVALLPTGVHGKAFWGCGARGQSCADWGFVLIYRIVLLQIDWGRVGACVRKSMTSHVTLGKSLPS